MTYEEFIIEYLLLVKEVPDDSDEATLVTGFLNEQMALSDFRLPLEELLVILKSQKPAIANYMDLIGNRDFKKLLNSEFTLEQALERIGAAKDYFQEPPQPTIK